MSTGRVSDIWSADIDNGYGHDVNGNVVRDEDFTIEMEALFSVTRMLKDALPYKDEYNDMGLHMFKGVRVSVGFSVQPGISCRRAFGRKLLFFWFLFDGAKL